MRLISATFSINGVPSLVGLIRALPTRIHEDVCELESPRERETERPRGLRETGIDIPNRDGILNIMLQFYSDCVTSSFQALMQFNHVNFVMRQESSFWYITTYIM